MTEIKVDMTKVAFLAAFAYIVGKGLEFIYGIAVAMMFQFPGATGGM